MVSKADQQAFKDMHEAEIFWPFHITGSYAIDPDTAQDIDLFIPQGEWPMYSSVYKEELKLEEYCPKQGDPKYDAAVETGEIVELYRGKHSINVIVVQDYFWPAYLSAMRELRNNPELYVDRMERHNLFIAEKNIIRRMLGQEPRALKTE